jgi:23S rRNA pseudouridine1911/1915/1917 synthase
MLELFKYINGKRRVSKTGQSAITYYKTVKKLKGGNSLVFVTLSTGRNHQIRVHFSHFNHPLLGDLMYGGSQKQIKRQALHSAVLDFCEPYTFKSIHLESPLPKDMKSLL